MNRTNSLQMTAIVIAWSSAVFAQAPPSATEIPLYAGASPGSEKWD